MKSLFASNVAAFPGATTTITRKEWQEHCANYDRTFFRNGELNEFKVRNVGGGVLELYAVKWKEKGQK